MTRRQPAAVLVAAITGCVALAACSSATDGGPAPGGSTPRASRSAGAQSSDQPEAALTLAAPTGPEPTGTTLIHLVEDRIDPLNPKAGRRQLMVQLWYPTAASARQPFAAYAPKGEVAALQKFYPVPAGAFDAEARTAARTRPSLPASTR